MREYVKNVRIEAEQCSFYNFLEQYRGKEYRDILQQEIVEDKDGYVIKHPDTFVSWLPKTTFEVTFV